MTAVKLLTAKVTAAKLWSLVPWYKMNKGNILNLSTELEKV